MKNKRCTITLLTFLLISVMSFAQEVETKVTQSIKYSYDNRGNRIKREVITVEVNQNNNNLTDSTVNTEFDYVVNSKTELQIVNTEELTEILIYPNPVADVLNINITEPNPSQQKLIKVYNTAGQQVLTQTPTDNQTQLNFATQPSGSYIICITINNKSYNQKIIKQ